MSEEKNTGTTDSTSGLYMSKRDVEYSRDSEDLEKSRIELDKRFKSVFRNVPILTTIIKETLPEYRDVDYDKLEKSIISLNCPTGVKTGNIKIEGGSETEVIAGDKSVIFDLRFKVHSPESLLSGTENETAKIELLFDLEMQNSLSLSYPLAKRGIYFGARMFSAELDTLESQEYGRLVPVYSIWLINDKKAAKSLQNTVRGYRMEPFTCSTYPDSKQTEQWDRNTDMIRLFYVFIGEEDMKEKGVIEFMQLILSKELESERMRKYLPFNNVDMKKEVTDMTSYAEYVEKQGLEKGIQGTVEILQDLGADDEIILQKIQEKFHLSYEEAKEYLS